MQAKKYIFALYALCGVTVLTLMGLALRRTSVIWIARTPARKLSLLAAMNSSVVREDVAAKRAKNTSGRNTASHFRADLKLGDPNPYDWLYGDKFVAALDRAAKNKKRIVFWHPPNDLRYTLTGEMSRECGSCVMFNDMKLIDDDQTDAVIFLAEDTTRGPMPEKRNPKQYWVWRTDEAMPYLSIHDWVRRTDKIKWNLTLDYRPDADIRMPYGNVAYLYENPIDPVEVMKKKTRTAFAAVTNCQVTPGAKARLKYLKELVKRNFAINLIGPCFGGAHIRRGDEESTSSHTATFKFHFSFENSFHCRQYITEKFFRPLYVATVPVVWGAKKEDYLEYVPSSAFIHIDDFDSIQSLVDYLNYLDKNDTAYLEYFKWRSEIPRPLDYRKQNSYCRLCRFLNGINIDDAYKVPVSKLSHNIDDYISDGPKPKTFPSIFHWYNDTEDPDCLVKNVDLDEKCNIVIKK